jgi:hypothetical protein
LFLLLLPFWVAGIGLAVSPLWRRKRVNNTLYVVTNRRAIVAQPSPFLLKPETRTWYLDADLIKAVEARIGGCGDIVFDYITNAYYKCKKRTASSPDNIKYWTPLCFSNLYVDDRIFGTSYVDVDLPNVTINRGNYTAMERHYILGEINSFDDLEKYRNNLFKL